MPVKTNLFKGTFFRCFGLRVEENSTKIDESIAFRKWNLRSDLPHSSSRESGCPGRGLDFRVMKTPQNRRQGL